jgi:hypothetical protein
MSRPIFRLAAILVVATAGAAAAQERLTIDIETGAAVSGYNDARIPGNTGTRFSLTGDLRSATAGFYRLRGELRVAPRHVVSVLAAPLTINAAGKFPRPVSFMGEIFDAGIPVTARYVFNSYRASYRYEFVQTGKWRVCVGVTGKIRDAETRLISSTQNVAKTNVGFVPLVNFAVERRLPRGVALQVAGDALAAPQGRAEDVFAGVLVPLARRVSIKAGYRLLEGGANNDEVYTFAAIHYLAVGAVVRF